MGRTTAKNMARQSRPNSYDVARRAGVSQSAVSRAFTPGTYVSELKRQKIFAAAGALGYRPNAIARSLTTSRSGIVAIIVSTIGNPIYPFVLNEFARRFHELDRQVFLVTHQIDPNEALLRALQYQTDGVVITAASPLAMSKRVAELCAQLRIPVVLFNRRFDDLGTPAVVCANSAGGARAAELLARAGHRRLAYIGGSEETSTNVDRRAGFLARVAALGLAAPRLERSPYSYEGGYQAMLRLMRGRDRPDGIFCANDVLAIGAMDAARREFGLAVPRDLSLIGFDDVPMAAWAGYDLSTMRPRFEDMVGQATELLLAQIRKLPLADTCIEVPCDPVLRGSVRARPPQPRRGTQA